MSKPLIYRDTREKEGKGWIFTPSTTFAGTEEKALPTGDYTLAGYEQEIVVERKGSLSEFSLNIFEDRFERELERLNGFAHPFIILEFSMEDIIAFPANSGIPKYKWKYLKVKPFLILKRLNYYELNYNTKFVLAGKYGKEYCASIFKNFLEMKK